MRFGSPIVLGAILLFSLLFITFSKRLLFENKEQTSTSNKFNNKQVKAVNDHVRPVTRSKYSGLPPSDGLLFTVDRHYVRRRRRRHVDITAEDRRQEASVKGVARDCHKACHLRLRSLDGQSYKIHLHRFHQLAPSHNKSIPTILNSDIVPLVQYFETEDSVTARLSRASPNCIYRARVVGSSDHSIVNLCDSDDGLFGLLAIPNKGIYTVEPIIHDDNSTTEDSSRHRSHVAHQIRSHTFRHQFDDTNSTSAEENPSIPSFHSNSTSEQPLWEDLAIRSPRSRRAANSWDHFVEVMVVTDVKMYEYHGYNLEDYVLTLFSTVASIYRHQSLRASINVVVVKIIILKHENQGPVVSSNAQETLQRFCRWQSLYNERSDESPSHHDVAILLTRGDICRAPGKCDTLGLAELGTMCDWQKSCAIIEDNGLSAAFTIAHELGHIFNIPHDDERRCSQFMHVTKSNYHIMAPTLEYNTHPWSWSECSSGMLEKFLDNNRGQIQCLFDQPVQRKYYEQLFESPAPGRKYDVNQQCKFVFGPQSELCPYMPTCRRLWCATYYGSQMGCRTQHMPWADGTPCDKSDQQPKYCHRGECVDMSPDRRSRTDGGWGEWQPWGTCTRTCGGGIQKALRDCDNPRPANGGKYCVGLREQYRSCNTQECPWDTPGFREVQCAEFNNKDVGIHGVSASSVWVPKYSGVASNERCKLYCRISGTAAAYLLRDKVTDGTPCDRNGDDICVDGTCMTSGCDHILQSTVRRDRCGICGGDDSSCRVVKGTYNERGSFGYNEVMKIPAGSANIDIRQHGYNNQKDDDNYLSLRAANGEFLLNGHFQVSVFRQHIPIQDVVLEYSGSDNVVERINGTGPIRSDIYVHVLSVGNLFPPDISYEYMTAVENKQRPPVHGYFWRHGERWSECDKVCQGSQRQELTCVDAMTNRPSNERNCKTRKPEINTRMCNIDCTIKWHTEDISRCSAQCGAGEKRLRVLCVRVDANRRTSPARESDCDRNTRPSERATCYIDCSGRRWAYTEWTPCSVTCGSGVSTRNASCLDDRGRRIDDMHCGLQTETLSRNCVQQACPRWVYGHWSECSRSCDGGVRMRHAQCLDAADRETEPRRCGTKLDREKCNEHLCTSWSFGQWSTCSVTCGVGIQTREAKCVDRENRQLDNGKCNYRERIVQKPCNRPSCPTWKIGDWTTCSVSCQDGWSTRRVSCADHRGQDVPTEQCQHAGDRPSSHKPCNQGPCPFWRSGDWSSCSVSCGTGSRQRSVECVYRDQVVDQSFCGESKVPERTQQCSLVPCANWEMTPWTLCSVSCGSGVQTREVFCASGAQRDRVNDHSCDKKNKPRAQKVCERDSCFTQPVYIAPLSEVPAIRWATGPWTPCSATCDTGNQKRLVKCRDQVRDLPDEYCRHIEKPDDQQSCQVKACAYWRSGPWKPCSATCGSHVQQSRTVQCVAYNPKQNVSEIDCDVSHRPAAVKSCKLDPCPQGEPPLGRWRTGDWDKCTKTCGSGWRRRSVSCSSNACDETTKPKSLDACNIHACPVSNNTWQISPWTHCSVTCGGGVQRRRIWCEDATTFVSKEDADCGDKKPVEQRDCELAPCPPRQEPVVPLRPQWQTSAWSSCSVKCGRGIRRRLVACVDTTTNATISTSLCDSKKKPIEEHKCRVTHCPRWRGSPWGPCSVTCGAGVRHREVFCQRGRRQRTNETECAASTKPPTEAKCYQPACPAYNWVTTPWSKCLDPCAKSQQHRRVYCMSNGGKRAAPRMCNAEKTPPTSKLCDITRCPYEWVPGPWQTCSKTCGKGTQSRKIECLVKSSQSSNLLAEHSVPKGKCEAMPMPKDQQDCDLNECEAEYQWQIGPWQACSKTCGHGVRRRKVRCFHRDGNRVPKQNCEAISTRPKRTQTCFERNCLPSTCQEIRSQAKTASKDGNYTVLLDGFPIVVYCHRMNETIPGTYINILPDSNYAEVYGKRLIYPHTCPYNGDRNDSCQCSDYGDAHAGFTRFSKIRVDLLNRKIKINDFTFATTINGSHVEYATAGDCYSMKDCPQGRFSVNLFGTGLRIVDDLQWEDKGHRTTSRIDRTFNNARIEGRCGGYCGKCSPDKYKGLVFEIDTKQVQPLS